MTSGEPQRLYQLRFDDAFELAEPEDITPKNFTGLASGESERFEVASGGLSRAIRELPERVPVRDADDAAHFLRTHVYTPFDDFLQEELYVLLLNVKHQITHVVQVYRGTVNGLYVRSAELFIAAVRVNAPAIIMAHNHPSGARVNPSPEDIRVTKQANEAAKLLDIELADHIVVGRDHCVSMKREGLF